jgi:hypothetical protein
MNFDGQECTHSPETKRLKTTIHKPYLGAGKALGWGTDVKKPIGLGFNFKIIDFIKKTKSTLVVSVGPDYHHYWATHDQISLFIKTHKTIHKTGGKLLVHVLPWELFKRYKDKASLDDYLS